MKEPFLNPMLVDRFILNLRNDDVVPSLHLWDTLIGGICLQQEYRRESYTFFRIYNTDLEIAGTFLMVFHKKDGTALASFKVKKAKGIAPEKLRQIRDDRAIEPVTTEAAGETYTEETDEDSNARFIVNILRCI